MNQAPGNPQSIVVSGQLVQQLTSDAAMLRGALSELKLDSSGHPLPRDADLESMAFRLLSTIDLVTGATSET
ncbi:hypothetical protein ACIBUY_03650 [Streptomyces sp. NPDC050085]|uniref:hypothetical protein n=1 Tax=Streptomyces sp. NPDC050085 TaxID=3365600 RepID=UPI0037AE31C2